MDESDNVLKELCCTCLSRERRLFQLCRLKDGVNNLYSILSFDAAAYKEVFYKDTASLRVCWVCKAVLRRISAFRSMASSVQKQLTLIEDGRTDIDVTKNTTFSNLKSTTIDTYDLCITDLDDTTDNFIDCGADDVDSDNDVPLSALHNFISDDDDAKTTSKVNVRKKKRTKKETSENGLSPDTYSEYFTTTEMSYEEIQKLRDEMKKSIAEAPYKCESCVEVFKTDTALDKHKEKFHSMKENLSQCFICRSYIPGDIMKIHISEHHTLLTCKCGYRTTREREAKSHVRGHQREKKKDIKMKRGGKVKGKPTDTDQVQSEATCPECNKSFDSKSKRWKHVQRFHREGFACEKCGKRFAFRNNLNRHVKLHLSPPPREQCQVCSKMIRCDLMKVHARIHASRERHACRECDKTFVSRASYEHHLKYTRAHANTDILKHKCSECGKGYRSRGELRDHIDYQHRGKTRHQCPECGKALATRRCVSRHVRRAHRGIKESARDKICQLCGKAFRDKKGLREHELIHSGERPLRCEVCGAAFRQSASLHTHRRRVHRMIPRRRTLLLNK